MMIAPLIEPNRSPTLESTVPSKFLLLRPRIILFLRCEEIIHTTDTMSEKEIIVMERFVNLFTVVLMPSRPNASNLVRSTLGMNCSKSISCPLNFFVSLPFIKSSIGSAKRSDLIVSVFRMPIMTPPETAASLTRDSRNPCDLPRSAHIKKINTIIISNTMTKLSNI